MQHELDLYFKSRKRLAAMVGADLDDFSDSDVEVSCSQNVWSCFLIVCVYNLTNKFNMVGFLDCCSEVLACLVVHYYLQDALRYLLPTRLTARDARPSLKVGSTHFYFSLLL